MTTRAERYGEELLEIDVASFVKALWQRRVRMLLVMIAAGVVAASVAWMREPEYAATSMLAVAREENRPLPIIPVSTYLPLAQDAAGAAEVIRALGLDRGPRTLTADALLGDHITIASSRDLATLTIEAKMWTADLAADVANRMAEKVVGRAAQIEGPTVSVLRTQTDAARARFKAAADNLASAGVDMGPEWTASLFLPRMEWSRDIAGAAAPGRVRPEVPRASHDKAKYSAFVDAVGDYEVATRVYVDVASVYEREVLRSETRSKTIQIVERATKPDRPVPIRLIRNAIMGLLAGVLMGALWIAIERAVKRSDIA